MIVARTITPNDEKPSELKMHPIEIIGGGLSGLSLGIALRRRGLPVTIFEAGEYPRHRVCGEFISGVSETDLKRLGIDQTLADAGRPNMVEWYQNDAFIRRDSLPRPAYTISRYELDLRLANQFQHLGGRLETRKRHLFDGRSGQIDCSGRRAAKDSPWLGLKCHLTGIERIEGLQIHLSPTGYAGICEVESGTYNLCGLFRKRTELKTKPEEILRSYLASCGLNRLVQLIDAGDIVEKSHCAVAALDYSADEAMQARLGDAGGLIPPFTGNGMSIAFESAACAIDPLTDYSKGTINWQRCLKQISSATEGAFGSRRQIARRLHGLLTHPTGLKLTGLWAKTPTFPFKTIFRLTH